MKKNIIFSSPSTQGLTYFGGFKNFILQSEKKLNFIFIFLSDRSYLLSAKENLLKGLLLSEVHLYWRSYHAELLDTAKQFF